MDIFSKTIYAAATPPGKSGVAIIRVSGPNAKLSLKELTTQSPFTPRCAHFSALYHPSSQELIDNAIILYFEAPNSFTGEDIVEFQIHGSRAVIGSVLDALSNLENYRLAEPGEFSKRAFNNGKMDLTEAEGLADLIEAETAMQQKQALRQMSGQLKNLYESWREQLINILAQTEAYIDFPEEDIPDDLVERTNNEIEELIKGMDKHLHDNNAGERVREGIQAVIIGEPNVGKSSLLNLLAKREVAIVSHLEGTTRDIIDIHLDINGYPVTISDTAGIRESKNLIEAEGIKRAKIRADQADIKILMIDATKKLSLETKKLIDKNTIILINKIDLAKSLNNIDGAIEISVSKKTGISEFLEVLESRIEDKSYNSADPMITRERYRIHLRECKKYLEDFSLDKDLVLASEDLRLAAVELGQITGTIDVESILDKIFSKFCIGK